MLVSGQTDSDTWGPVTFTSGSTAQWARTGGPNSGQVYCFAVSSTSLFTGTDGGGVFLSTDDGTSWSAVNTGLTNKRVKALFIPPVSGGLFAGTLGGGILLSTNNGTSWSGVSTGLTNSSVHAFAVSGVNLFAGTFGGGVFLSTNNGTSWTGINTCLTNTSVTALAVSGVNLYAATSTGGVFLSTNNGASWTAVNTGLTNPYVDDLAVSGTNLYAGTYDGVFLSTNNGTSWTQTSMKGTVVTSLAVSGANLFACTTVGVHMSTNNGTSWREVNTGLTDTNVWSLAILGANLFAGTMYSGVWKRPLADMVTSVGEFSTYLPTQFSLDQNYPNPFNPLTCIQYSVSEASHVSLKVFNVLGEEIATLAGENKAPGNYRVTWDASGYPSGVYLYRLISAGRISTGRMTLLK